MGAYVVRVRKVYPSLPSRRPPQDRRPFPRRRVWRPFFDFFLFFFRMQKNVEKTERQKTTFFAIFSDFGSPRRRFFVIFGPKTGPRRLLFRCFFENGDFVKIVLPLWWEHSFGGSDPPKIDPESDSERHRREKMMKIASGAVSGRTFSVPGPFFVDFGLPAGSQNRLQNRPRKKLYWNFSGRNLCFCIFFAQARSGRVPERFRRLRGPSRSRFR